MIVPEKLLLELEDLQQLGRRMGVNLSEQFDLRSTSGGDGPLNDNV
jgi:hypothetical protein